MKKTLFLSAILGAALCSSAYGARTLADYSTTDGEMTFSGAIIEYTGTSNNQAIGTSGVTFNINKSGTTYQKKGASQNPDFGGTNNNLWEYLTTHKDNVVYGQTLKMSGSTGSAVKLNTGGMGHTLFGGLITSSANNNASYTLDASSGDVILKGNDSGANMNIGSNTTLSTSTNNTVEVQSSGTWNIQQGKSLTLAGGRFWINGANTVTLSGGGTLKFNIGNTNKLQLDANSGFNITGGTTVEMNDGLKCEFSDGAAFSSTDGTGKINYAVTAKQTAGATNGFGTLTYATPGNLSIGSGVTLLLNGVEADYTDGTLSTASTIYHIVENTAFNVASMSSYTGATGFQIESGATLRITEKTTNNNGIIYGAVTVKNGGVLQLDANDALGWSGNNVKSLLVENGAEVKLTHSSNETWGGVLTLQGNAKISGDNARWDMYNNSSATVAASANATLDIKELCLRRDDVTFTLGNNATLTINSALTKGSESQNGKLIITANHGSGAIVNLNGEANNGVIGLQFAGVTANINEDMTVTQLMLSKNDALTTVNVAAGKTLTITGTTMPTTGGSFELANWARNNVLNIEGTVIANSGITTEGSNAKPTINIKNGGILTMNAGLSAVSRLGGSTQTTINVESGATLNMGGTADLADSTLITVNVKDGSILGGAYGSGTTAIINKNFALAENAAVTLQTAAEKQLTFNGTFGTETNSLIVQGGGSATLGEATSALASVNVKENTTLHFGGAVTISNGLTIGAGASVEADGTLTLAGASSYTGATQTRAEQPTDANGFGATITYANVISGAGAVNSTAAWTLNGTAATLNGKELSYSTATNVYYINTDAAITNITADHIGNEGGKNTTDVTLNGNASTVGMKLTGTQTGTTYTFSGSITGAGNLVIEPTTPAAENLSDTYVFSGNISGWHGEGSGSVIATSNTALTFTGDATEINVNTIASGGHISATYNHGKEITVNGEVMNDKWTKGVVDITVTNDTAATFNGTVHADLLTVDRGSSASINSGSTVKNLGGDGTVKALADLTVTGEEGQGTDVTLGGLDIAGNTTVTLGTEESHNNTLTLNNLTVSATAGQQAKLNANLVIADNGTIDFSNGGVLTLGCSISIGDNVTVTVSDATFQELLDHEDGTFIALFDSVETISKLPSAITVKNASETEEGVFYMSYNGEQVGIVPEPATATLSLLALAALAARRRRH